MRDLLLVFGLLLLAAAGLWFMWKQRANERLARARAKIEQDRAEHAELVPKVEQLNLDANQLLAQVGGEVAAQVRAMTAELNKLATDVSATVAALPSPGESISGNLGKQNRSNRETFRALRREIKSGGNIVKTASHRVEAVSHSVTELDQILADTSRSAEAQQAEGWDVTPIVSDLSELSDEAENPRQGAADRSRRSRTGTQNAD